MTTELLEAERVSSRHPGRVYKRLANGGLGLDLIADPVVDSKKMTAKAVICTSDVDRDSEVILPGGVGTTNYVKNPIVLWEHGFNEQVPAPIAKCEHPDGSLALSFSKDAIEATSYFTNRNRDSEQFFALIDERIVRATSIHVDPDYSQVRRDRSVVIYPASELLEWSWCMIGVNPEAVAKTVARNRLAGSPISEPLLKSLKSWLPPKRALGRGWDNPGGSHVGKAKAKGKAEQPQDAEPEKETPEGEAAESESPAQDAVPETETTVESPTDEAEQGGGETKSDDSNAPAEETPATEPPAPGHPAIEGEPGETTTDDQVDEGTQANSDSMKYGAQLLAGAHAAASDMLSQVQAGIGPLENADAKAALTAFMEHEQEGLAMLEGAYSSCYPGAGQMPSKAKSQSTPDEEREALAKFIASGQRAQLQFGGLVGRISAVAKSTNITHEQRTLLNDVVRQLSGLAAKAKSVAKSSAAPKSDAPAPESAAISEQSVSELTSLRGELQELTGLIKSLTPANGNS